MATPEKLSADILAKLNEPQQQAVTTVNGPVLVLAGAGSGKTRTLVHRLAYLLAVEHIPASQVLAVTFTNQAAREMRERVAALTSSVGAGQPMVGTFHAVSCRFLRHEARHVGYQANFSIYDEDDQLSLVKQAMKERDLSPKQINPRAVLNAISRAKAELVEPEQYAEFVEPSPFQTTVGELYVRYQQLLAREQAMDFDDLLGQMVTVWQQHPEVLAAYQRRFRYLLVDEYQDVNRAQYVWTKLLAEGSRNLCVVGDDWQSIYSWRGADFGNILRFEEDYPDARVIKLEQNYRSTKVIIAASNAVMAKAERKADKTLWTNNPQGAAIQIVEVEDEVAEARFVVGEIIKQAGGSSGVQELTYLPEREREFLPEVGPVARYYGNGEELTGFAVLYRTNAQSRALEEACLKVGLPYQLIGGTRFYERKEIKDVLAYLRLMVNPWDGASLRRVATNSARGFGLASAEAILKAAESAGALPLTLNPDEVLSGSRITAFKEFEEIIGKLTSLMSERTVSEMIDFVLELGGLRRELLDGTPEGEGRYQNVLELKTVAAERAPGKGQESLEQFLTEITLWQDQDSYRRGGKGITLMTFHAAKGLEFSTVFMVGMEEGLFPHTSAMDDPRELEEERRLAYVGLTRAKQQVYCLYAVNRRIFGTVYPGIPSRFLGELPEEFIQARTVNEI